MVDCRPFLKWAGGKFKVFDQYLKYFPVHFNRYIEPFCGSSAVFFRITNQDRTISKKTILNDLNSQLVSTYITVKELVGDLIYELFETGYYLNNSERYCEIRDLVCSKLDRVKSAARFIYLNKYGFNGLYRVNSKGNFNVPFGKNSTIDKVAYASNLKNVSERLSDVIILNSGFQDVCYLASERDFVYCDPPYVPISKTSNFVGYSVDGFGEVHQKDLFNIFKFLSNKNVYCAISNSDCQYVRELYREFKLIEISAKRSINSKATGRGNVGELLIVNY